MSNAQSDMQVAPMRSGVGGLVHSRVRATLGAVGVVLTTSATIPSDPGIVLTKTGTTGAYSLAYPPSPGDVSIIVTVISPLGTICSNTYLSAQNAGAGTATIVFSAPNGTAAYGASGDIIIIDMFGQAYSATGTN